MAYLNDDGVVFCTLAIGDEYRDRVATQLQSILKFTNYHAYVVTDKPEVFGNWYGPRIHFLQYDENLTSMPLKSPQGMFNYNLKMIPIKWVVENIKPTITIYMDADSFLFGGLPYHFDKYFNPNEHGIYGRFRQPLNTVDDRLVLKKIEMMGLDITNIDTRLPIENILVFKNGTLLKPFLDEWLRLAELALSSGARGDFEALEMAVAIHNSGVFYQHMDGHSHPWVDCFRTLHHGKHHIPFIV